MVNNPPSTADNLLRIEHAAFRGGDILFCLFRRGSSIVAATNSDAAYVEFEEALANVLAEHPQKDGIARRSRLARLDRHARAR